jgi:HEAT repeat protein
MRNVKTYETLVAALLVAVVAFGTGRGFAGESEDKLLGVLKSNADRKAKADACMALSHVATKASVPTLAALLSNEELAHMARYALEPIPDPSVEEALRDALGKLKGRLRVGVIGSLGVRRDAKAVPALAALLQDQDRDTAQGAARALGSIATPEAIKALLDAEPKTSARNKLAFHEGLFRGAEALLKEGKKKEAQAVYDALRAKKDVAHQVRTAALRGAVLTRGEAGIPLLLEAWRNEDYGLATAAARTGMELPGEAVTKALADELGKLPVDKQILMTKVLGKRGDAAATPALVALVKNGKKEARMAALRALPEVGGGEAVPLLLSLFNDPEIGSLARDTLAAMPGKSVDSAVGAMLEDKDAQTRVLAIDLLAMRQVKGVLPQLMKAAEDNDEKVRAAAIKALGKLAGLSEFAALVDLLLKAKTPAEISAYEGTLAAICTREARLSPSDVVIKKALYGDLPNGKAADVKKKVAGMIKAGQLKIEASNSNFGDPTPGVAKSFTIEYSVAGVSDSLTVKENESVTLSGGVTPAACVDPLCAAVGKAEKAPKLALLSVMRTARGPKVLEAVRAAAKDADPEVKATAVRALCDWTVEALPDIRALLKSPDKKTQILALRGCMRLIPQQNLPVAKKLAELKEIMDQIERPEEKRLGLAALGALPSAEALALVVPNLSDAAVKEEACLAAIAISEKLVKTQKAKVAEAMGQVVKTTRNRRVKKRAQELLAEAKK